ncbi:MAG: leucine-rich repeat domain-containing protein [Lachnospiraceae bacterium]|nr:leucine-rich repeat domain-containing protein [Lachnospiraceae bacterium]
MKKTGRKVLTVLLALLMTVMAAAPAHAEVLEFDYDGDDVTFIKANGDGFGMFTRQAGTTCVINGDNVEIHYVPKNVKTYGAFHYGSITDAELTPDVVFNSDGTFDIVLPKENCGTALPIAPIKKSDGGTTAAQYYLAIPAAGKLEDVTPVTSGTCGANATWSFADNTLTISGTGAMTSYSSKNDTPWAALADQIRFITVDDGITSIGNNAFAGCENAENASIGEDVAAIGVNAFSGCEKLTELVIPASVASIGNYAFNNCSDLGVIIFEGSSAPSFGANALANTELMAIYKASWTGFSKDKLGGKTTWLVDYVAGSCGATRFTLERGHLTISGTGSIRGYSKGETPWYQYRDEIQTLNIGDGVTSIGNYAFYGCENLTGVTFGSGITGIGISAFYGCASLAEIEFPAALASIGAYAFSNCSGLTDLTFTGSSAPTIAGTGFNTVKAKALYPENAAWAEFAKNGYGGAIYWTTNPEEEIIGGSCGNQAAWILVDGTLTLYGQGGVRSYGAKTQVPWYEYREQITRIVVEDGITSLGNYQFMGCENVTEVYLSNTLRKICVNAFSTCRSLTTITIPATVTDIYAYAFNKCSGLQNVVFEGEVSGIQINGHAFENTTVELPQ